MPWNGGGNPYVCGCAELRAEIERLKSKVNDVLVDRAASMHELQTEIERLKAEIEKYERRLEEVKAQWADVMCRLGDANGEIERLKDKIEWLKRDQALSELAAPKADPWWNSKSPWEAR